MELIQTAVRGKIRKDPIIHQFYEDFDYNVPDARDDIREVVEGLATIKLTPPVVADRYLKISGEIHFQVLCMAQTESRRLLCLSGTHPVEETIFVGEDLEELSYQVSCSRLEVTPTLIHSRKLGLKCQIELLIEPEQEWERQITQEVELEEAMSPQDAYTLHKRYVEGKALTLVSDHRDTYRVKEEMKLSGTKENIDQVILSDVQNLCLETKARGDEILLQGEIQVFVMYQSEEESPDWVEENVRFEGKIPCYGLEEGMYHRVTGVLSDAMIEPRLDEDGEMRIFGVEVTVNLAIEVYQELNIEVLEDAYSCEKKCILTREQDPLESLILSNQSRYKLGERIQVPELGDEVLQICHSQGNLQVENQTRTEDGIRIEGTLHLHFLYVRADDEKPYGTWQGMIPFSHLVAAPGLLEQENQILVGSTLAQVSIAMTGSAEVEVKALMEFDCMIKGVWSCDTISGIQVEEYTKEELELDAGIIGYMVKEGDDLWSLAKKYHTTEEGIMEVNELPEKDIKPGEKILLFKENVSIL